MNLFTELGGLDAATSPADEDRAVPDSNRLRMMEVILNAAPGLVSYWGRDLLCRYSNAAQADWFGLTPKDMIGIRYETLLGEAVVALDRAHVKAVLAGEAQRFERDLPNPSRGLVPTLNHYAPDVVDGVVVGFTAHVTDVSLIRDAGAALLEEVEERQRANRIIRASVEALEAARRLGQIGGWIWSASPDVVVWSRALFRIMGRDPASPAPNFAEQRRLYAPDSWSRLQVLVDLAMSTGEPYRVELEYIRPDGDRGWLDARGEAVRRRDGRIIGLRGEVRTMTSGGAEHRPAPSGDRA